MRTVWLFIVKKRHSNGLIFMTFGGKIVSNKISAEVEIIVPFFDIDPMNIVWHGHYVKYFELARCAVLDRISYGYSAMKQSGYAWPVIDMRVRYIKSATLGQKIICKATITEYEHRLKIDYEITNAATKERLTKGHSVQVAIDMSNNEMQLVSPKLLYNKIETAQ